MCHHVFIYDDRDKSNNSQTNSSIKYISNMYEGLMQNKLNTYQTHKYVFQSMC